MVKWFILIVAVVGGRFGYIHFGVWGAIFGVPVGACIGYFSILAAVLLQAMVSRIVFGRTTLPPRKPERERVVRLSPASADVNPYPKARYRGTNDEVALGDHVSVPHFIFWRKPGRIAYVPGISRPNRHFEDRGIRLIYVEVPTGGSFAVSVDSKTGEIPGYIRLISRSEEPYAGLPDNYEME